ncbi:MAG: glycosyltransferase family 39 protein [Parcubacteria group bacterium]|nr:glycosyltransferase family 39 protein [Parcubacteria group bacterium]
MIEKIKAHKIEIFGLIAILLMAGFFYFYNITQKGLFGYDEAFQMLTGNSYAQIPKIGVNYLLGNGTLEDLTAKYLPGNVFFQMSSRPTFAFLNALGITIFGYHDYSIFIMDGILGLLSIVVLYFIAKKITKSYKFALFAVFLFGISGYQIYAARGAFSTILAGFFALCGSFFYIRNIYGKSYEESLNLKSDLMLAGFFWGLMFASHYSSLFFLMSVGLFEIFMFYLSAPVSWKVFFKRLAFLAISFLSVIFFIEILLQLISYLLTKAGYPHHRVASYFYELWRFFKGDLISDMYNVNPQDFWFYGRMINILNGLPYLILFLISPIVFFWRKYRQNLSLIFVFFAAMGMFLFASLNGFAVPRAMVQINGFVSLAAALVFWEIFHLMKKNYRGFGYFLFIILLVVQMRINWEIVNLKSGYKEAAEFLSKEGIPSEDIYTETWPIFSFYLNKKTQIYNRSHRTIYYVAEYHENKSVDTYDFNIISQGKLLATFDNPIGKFSPVRAEVWVPRLPTKWPAAEPDKIKIYKVNR